MKRLGWVLVSCVLLAMPAIAQPAPTPADGFAPSRRGPTGDVRGGYIPELLVGEAFKEIRTRADALLAERAEAATTSAERARLAGAKGTLSKLTVEVLPTNDVIAVRVGTTVRVSEGLLTQIYERSMANMNAGRIDAGQRGMFQARLLSLILAHEVAHAAGIRAERVADAEAVRILKSSPMLAGLNEAELAETLRVFDKPTGSSRIDTLLHRLRSFMRYGTLGGRTRNLERALRGEADPFARYRRGDGTVRWTQVTRDGVLREAGGAAKFALALFLKEVAVVAATGDRARIEEFFDHLGTTEFYKQYGLFVVGARLGEVGYTRYLQRYIKPGFVNGILKTNMILAAGVALPMIVEGRFSGRAFALSVSSLGLSTAAVRGGVASLKWVMNLKKAKNAGLLGRAGASAGRLARVGGWFYTVAELAVILYVAEAVETKANEVLDTRAARAALADAAEAFLERANAEGATPEDVAEATRDYQDAWNAYREFLNRKLHADEAVFAGRMAKLSRRAKLLADARVATLKRLASHAALRASVEARHGTLEAYAAHLASGDDRGLMSDLATATASYERVREDHLREVYEDGRRDTPLLEGADARDWHMSGAKSGAAHDPWGSRTGLFADLGRSRARSAFRSALGDASTNRLETYEHEAEVLAALASSLSARGRADLATAVEAGRDHTLRLAKADAGLVKTGGVVEALERD